MANFSSDHMTARTGRDAWMYDNERGLALAADGDWVEASEAFAAAADSLARPLPSESRGSHEPLALVLSNLAQAYFRCGRLDDAMQQAQRTCALRVAIAGEDGMPVARARMDLAVMLASAGRLDEATMLVQRSISAIEHRVGEEDARLAIVLENAARIALAAGQPANAEPLLIRLHALLDAHELSTSRAEELLARVATARAAQPFAESLATATTSAPRAEAHDLEVRTGTPAALPAFDDDDAARIYAHASIAEHEEWEDQPLRDAVAVTDILLRTTPSGVPVIPALRALDPPSLDNGVSAGNEADALLDTLDVSDVLPAPVVREADAGQLLSLEPTPSSGVDFDLDLAFDEPVSSAVSSLDALDVVDLAASVPDMPALEDPTPAATRPPSLGHLTLDFAVEHGMPDDEARIQGPPISSPVPDALDVVPMEPPAPRVVPVTEIITSGPTGGITPMADIEQSAPLMNASGAVPASRPASATRDTEKTSRTAATSGERPVRRSAEPRVVLPKQDAKASGGTGKLVAIIVGVLAVGGGAAAFFLLR